MSKNTDLDNINDIGILGIFAMVVLFLFVFLIWFFVVISLINLIWKIINKPGKKTTADYLWIIFSFFLLFIFFGGFGLFR